MMPADQAQQRGQGQTGKEEDKAGLPDPAEAIRLCQSARQMVQGKEELIEAILLEVDALINLGCPEDAKKRLSEINLSEPLTAAYEMMLGRALYEVGDQDRAKTFIDRAIGADQENPDAWYYRGLIAKDEKRPAESINAFKKVLELDRLTPIPPWSKHLHPIEPLIHRAIDELDSDEKAMLERTEIIAEKCPSEHQVENGVDPRQSVFIDGIDTVGELNSKLWVFTHNLARAGVMPNTATKDLVGIIRIELKSRRIRV